MPGLLVREVSVRFGGLSALDRVSFEVPARGVVGVIGPNGAGKTTLFNVISGLVQPSSGSLMFQDKDFRPIPEHLTRMGISRTLQAVGLFPRMTAVENVMVGAARTRRSGFAGAFFATLGADRDERRIRAESVDWLARFGVADSAGKVAATLPYGVQKKVALARALVSDPTLLLLDEPAAGLGPDDLAELGELIRSLPTRVDNPCAVLLVEHHMDLVMNVCDRVVVLDFGRVVASGAPAEVSADPVVAAAYLGADVPDSLPADLPSGWGADTSGEAR
jgi:branched-chain amino acid transport system ATP-binding protein